MRRRCLSGRHVHEHAFEYAERFFRVYKEVPRIAFVGLNEGNETNKRKERALSFVFESSLFFRRP